MYIDEDAAPAVWIKKWLFRRTEDGRLGIDLAKFYRSPCHYEKMDDNA